MTNNTRSAIQLKGWTVRDTAYLRNAAGRTIDTCTWKSGTAPTYC